MNISKIISLFSIAFFGFIIWMIYLANTGQSSIFFELSTSIPYGDKLAHFCLFGLLTLGANFVFKFKSFQVAKFDIYLGSIFVLTFSLIEEISQYFIPNRTFDLVDFIAGVSGIIVFHFMTKLLIKHTYESV